MHVRHLEKSQPRLILKQQLVPRLLTSSCGTVWLGSGCAIVTRADGRVPRRFAERQLDQGRQSISSQLRWRPSFSISTG